MRADVSGRGSLDGIVVADFSRILAGPLATQMLADAGARVIKIEEADRGDETRRWGPPFAAGVATYFLALNRGKQSIAVNLKDPRGKEIAARLIALADVVLHNFRDDQAAQFGLDPETVRDVNPRAVHCAIRGFERGTAEESLPGFDLLAQAAGGLMAITGAPGGMPVKTGVAIADVLAAHWAHSAILAALFERERTGAARSVEISLSGAAVASLVNVGQAFLATHQEPGRWGNAHPSIVPYQAFEGSDRSFVVAAGSDRQWVALAREVIGDVSLAADADYVTNSLRVENRERLIAHLTRVFAARPAIEWVERCREADVPAALVATYEETFSGVGAPLVSAMDHPLAGRVNFVGSPLLWDGVRRSSELPPPLVGQHSTEVLAEVGLTSSEIEEILSAGVVTQAKSPSGM